MIAAGVTVVATTICFFAQHSPPQPIKMPDGTTLTLLSVRYGQSYAPAPDRNPAKRVWAMLKEKLMRKNPGYDHSVVFWFREDPIQPLNRSPYKCLVVLDDALKPVHRAPIHDNFSATKQNGKPGVLGVILKNCPTNCPEITLSFYQRSPPAPAPVQQPKMLGLAWGQPPGSFHLPEKYKIQETEELDQTNLLGRITVKNPAFP